MGTTGYLPPLKIIPVLFGHTVYEECVYRERCSELCYTKMLMCSTSHVCKYSTPEDEVIFETRCVRHLSTTPRNRITRYFIILATKTCTMKHRL